MHRLSRVYLILQNKKIGRRSQKFRVMCCSLQKLSYLKIFTYGIETHVYCTVQLMLHAQVFKAFKVHWTYSKCDYIIMLRNLNTHIHARTHTHTHTHMRACTHMHARIHTRTHTCARAHTHSLLIYSTTLEKFNTWGFLCLMVNNVS